MKTAHYQKEMDALREYQRMRKSFNQDSIMMGNKIRDKLQESETRKIVRSLFAPLKSIMDGSVNCVRHDYYHEGLQSRQEIISSSIYSPFSEDQINWVEQELH